MTTVIGLERKRLPYLDYARVFCAYLVIFGHLLSNNDICIRPYIYSFHMPFFFLVSGILHKYNGMVQLDKYVRTLLYPYVFFNLVFLLLKPVCLYFGIWQDGRFVDMGFGETLYRFAKFSVKGTLFGSYCPDQVTWFLPALFWCKVLCDILKKYQKLWLLFVAMFYFFTLKRNSFLFLSQACMALPFYYIGHRCKDLFNRIPVVCNLYKIILFLIVIFVSFLLTHYCNGNVSMWDYKFGQFSYPYNIIMFYFNGLVASVGVLALASCFKENNVVETIALSLITILGAQNLFINSFQRYVWDNYVLCIVLAFIILICCVYINKFLQKKCPIVLGKVKQKISNE